MRASLSKCVISIHVVDLILKNLTFRILSLLQISVVNCQNLLETVNMRRIQPYCTSQNLEMADNVASDQMARIYQDLCSYSGPQRPACYRDNMPITA